MHDKRDARTDHEFGVGDDGISNVTEAKVRASSTYKMEQSMPASNLLDHDLGTAWMEGDTGYGIGAYMDFFFDLRTSSDTGSALSINSFLVSNGYRETDRLWRLNCRVKKLLMSVNGKPFAHVLLSDTYKLQEVSFKDKWFRYGTLSVVRFTIEEVYPGENNYKHTAISEIMFDGKYVGNMRE